MWNKLKCFFNAESGNTAVIFALSIVPLMLAAGTSVDMVRATRAQAMLQAAADAAALGAGANIESFRGGGGGNASQMSASATALVEDYISINNAGKAVDSLESVDASVDFDKKILTVVVKGKMKTSLMQLVGIDNMDVSVTAAVGLGSRALEVALVLDNTGSMSGQKIADLKASANNLVDILFEEKADFSILKIGVVPFSEYVNIGTGTPASPWLEALVEPPGSAWEGCVGSRISPRDSEISTGGSGKYVPVGGVHCVQPILDLSQVQGDIQGKINSMTAEGNTYIPAGLVWGWNMLDENAPLAAGMSKAELKTLNGKKAIVLMTDGANTISANAPFHNGTNTSNADSLTSQLCANAKADDIVVFTVAFQVPSQGIKDILEACASEPSKAFDATNGAALNAAFAEIGKQLATLYLAE